MHTAPGAWLNVCSRRCQAQALSRVVLTVCTTDHKWKHSRWLRTRGSPRDPRCKVESCCRSLLHALHFCASSCVPYGRPLTEGSATEMPHKRILFHLPLHTADEQGDCRIFPSTPDSVSRRVGPRGEQRQLTEAPSASSHLECHVTSGRSIY